MPHRPAFHRSSAGEAPAGEPTLLIRALRSARAAALWLLGPLDRMVRKAQGRDELPPLWLRRHVGPLRAFESAARGTATLIDELAPLRGDETVLDVGCGCGAMMPELLARLGPQGRYVGFDVHRPSIRWCERRFSHDRRCELHFADLSSPYAAGGADGRPRAVTSYRFPLDNGAAQLVLAKSVSTHFLAPEATHYLAEIGRVLAPTGRALVSFFLFDDRAGATPPRAFPHGDGHAQQVRWRRRGHPRAAVAFGRSFVEELVERCGLELVTLRPGFWPGTDRKPTGQDVLVLRRRAAAADPMEGDANG
jgi:SAM-dependent methyltransferase